MKKRLTAVSLVALRAKERAYYVSDDQQVGLRVRVAPSGATSWNIAYRIKGEPGTKSLSLGTCDPSGKNGLGLMEARARAAEIIKAARQGRDLIEEESRDRQAKKELLTTGELIARYAKNIKSPHRRGGALRSSEDIERRLKRALQNKVNSAAEDLRRSDISSILDPIAEETPREAEKRRQVIGAMYRWALAKGYVTIDPTAGSETYGQGDPRERVLSPSEISALWSWLNAGADRMPPDCICVLRLQLCTGARVGEIAGMDASEIRSDGRWLLWTLPASRSKNRNERITPIVGTARLIVEQALDHHASGPLFRTALTDRPLKATDLGHALKHRTLPCKHFTTHDLRRTVVSGMDEMGIALDTIASVIGHQRGSRGTRTLLRHYSRPRLDERIEAALMAWDRRLRDIVDPGARPTNQNVMRLRA